LYEKSRDVEPFRREEKDMQDCEDGMKKVLHTLDSTTPNPHRGDNYLNIAKIL
jgi:hypothetical protein